MQRVIRRFTFSQSLIIAELRFLEIEYKIKERKRDIKLNKSSRAVVRVNNKSPLTIHFNNVEKLANYNNLNYALLRKATEIVTVHSDICNDLFHPTIDNTCRYLLSVG